MFRTRKMEDTERATTEKDGSSGCGIVIKAVDGVKSDHNQHKLFLKVCTAKEAEVAGDLGPAFRAKGERMHDDGMHRQST